MAFERISGLFKRGPKLDKTKTQTAEDGRIADEPRPLAHPSAHASEDRHELLETLDSGFGQVAGVLHRLDHHLQANTELLSTLQQSQSQLPGLLQAQQKLVQMTASAERGNQAVLQALSINLKQRDEAQQAAMRQLGLLTQAANEHRDHYHDQLQLVMRLNGSNRRVLLLLLILSMLLAGMFFSLFAVAILRPDIFRNAVSRLSNEPPPSTHFEYTTPPR